MLASRRAAFLALALIGLAFATIFPRPILDGASPPSSLAAPVNAAAITAQATSACTITGTKTAAPAVVSMSERVEILIQAKVDCPSQPLHIVLAIDTSASMTFNEDRMREVKRQGRDFVERLDLPNHPERKVAVVTFDDDAGRPCRLTNDESRLISRCLFRLDANGSSTRIDLGLREAVDELRGARADAPSPPAEHIVLFSDGYDQQFDCRAAQREAGQADRDGVAITSICMGQDCQEDCMRDLRRGGGAYHEADPAAELRTILVTVHEALEAEAGGGTVSTARLVDPLSLAFAPIPGDVAPPPDAGSSPVRPAWTLDGAQLAEGVTVTIGVRPRMAGRRPTNAGAGLRFTDSLGLPGSFTFPDPFVQVLAPPTATPTLTPEPTTAPPPTATQTTQPTPFPTATWVPTPGPIETSTAQASATEPSTSRTPPPTITTGGGRIYTPYTAKQHQLGRWAPGVASPTPPPATAPLNGDFELGLARWREGGELPRTVTERSEDVRWGRRAALLGEPGYGTGETGNVPVGSAWIEQTVPVPYTTEPRLTLWYRVIAHEPATDAADPDRRWDSFDVWIDGASVAQLGAPAGHSLGERYDSLWQRLEIDLGTWRGTSIDLRLAAYNRSDTPGRTLEYFNTWAYVDDVRVEP